MLFCLLLFLPACPALLPPLPPCLLPIPHPVSRRYVSVSVQGGSRNRMAPFSLFKGGGGSGKARTRDGGPGGKKKEAGGGGKRRPAWEERVT